MGLNLGEHFGNGGNKPFDWSTKQIGSFVEGTVLDTRTAQRRKFMGKGKPVGDPEFWNNDTNQPIMQLVITVSTSERDPSDPQDDGARDVYLPGWGDTFRRVQKAMRAHNGTIEDGATVRVTWISGQGVSGDGRQFDFAYRPPVKGFDVGIPAPDPAATPAPAPQANPDPWAVQPSTPPPAAPPVAQQAPAPAQAAPAVPAGQHAVTQAQYDQFKTMGLDMAQFVVVPG